MRRPEGKRPLRRPRRKYEDSTKMDSKKVICDAGNWMDLVQDRDQLRTCVRLVMNLLVP